MIFEQNSREKMEIQISSFLKKFPFAEKVICKERQSKIDVTVCIHNSWRKEVVSSSPILSDLRL